ncbi:MAG: hypothetical protein WCH98_03985 [Verrucomicrobiota bacterium]
MTRLITQTLAILFVFQATIAFTQNPQPPVEDKALKEISEIQQGLKEGKYARSIELFTLLRQSTGFQYNLNDPSKIGEFWRLSETIGDDLANLERYLADFSASRARLDSLGADSDTKSYARQEKDKLMAPIGKFAAKVAAALPKLETLYLAAKQQQIEADKQKAADAEKEKQIQSERAVASRKAQEEARQASEKEPFNQMLVKYNAVRGTTLPYLINFQLEKDKYYYINPCVVSQVTNEFILAADLKKNPRAIIIFDDPKALERISVQQGWIVEGIGHFVAFQTVTMVNGADQRYPVFSCAGIRTMGRDFINTEKKD